MFLVLEARIREECLSISRFTKLVRGEQVLTCYLPSSTHLGFRVSFLYPELPLPAKGNLLTSFFHASQVRAGDFRTSKIRNRQERHILDPLSSESNDLDVLPFFYEPWIRIQKHFTLP